MIIVKLMGGLGNQMFQYATGRSLSLRLGTELKLDLSFLEGDQTGNTPRSYALDQFAINAVKAMPWEIARMTGCGTTFVQRITARAVKKACGCLAYRENLFPVNPAFFSLPDNTHLEGYWQSERYFIQYRDIIRAELAVKSPLSGKNRELAEEIRGVNAISLHVRRGDYVADERTKAMHHVCDLPYYREAEDQVAQAVENPHFFVFSDDPDWAQRHLKLRHPASYLGHNALIAHEDLRLMTLCRHHVIANSSFSWWGAWLCTSEDHLVIAPKRWFNDPSIDTSDVTPSEWCRI